MKMAVQYSYSSSGATVLELSEFGIAVLGDPSDAYHSGYVTGHYEDTECYSTDLER